MDKQIILLVIMFFGLLLKALITAVKDSTWTAIKTKKFYLFLCLNLGAPVILLFAESLFRLSQKNLANEILLSPQGYFTAGFILDIILYGISLLFLFLSLKLWPFDKGDRSTFKTLIWVIVVVLVCELVTGFKNPGQLYRGPLA